MVYPRLIGLLVLPAVAKILVKFLRVKKCLVRWQQKSNCVFIDWITNQVCEYWREIKKDRTYPKKSDIDFEEIVELLPYCVIIKITPTNKEVKYEYDHLGDMVDKFYNEGVFG